MSIYWITNLCLQRANQRNDHEDGNIVKDYKFWLKAVFGKTDEMCRG